MRRRPPDPHLLDPDEAAELARRHAEPVIANDLAAIAAHLDAGTLPDDRLRSMFAAIATRYWGRHRLTTDQHARYKALATRAVKELHGGRYLLDGVAWHSDGVTLRAQLPTTEATP